MFEDLDQVREISWEWMINYNERRPMTPWAGCRRLCIEN
jgi:hypothetical protein